ncbi:conserved hypothetical protein [Candidatus Terasakiella magnetica]|nr:conserved hypothetical protein [Candidatus Terasakiella magnetica]
MSASEISVLERRAYTQFCGELFNRTFTYPLPPVLWHYTNGTSLISILESGRLFATQLACLNDQTEYRYSVNLYRQAMLALWPSAKSTETEHLFGLIDEHLSPERYATSRNEWFVTCFSEMRDDLSQWRAYGGGENGYAIGFDTMALAQGILAHSSWMVPVRYDKAANESLVANIAQATIRHFHEGFARRPGADPKDWALTFLIAWTKEIGYFAPFLKDPAFAAEKEWRIAHELNSGDILNMKYLQRTALMSRHIPLPYPPPTEPNSKLLPIKEILVGPGRHQTVSRISVGDLLLTCGYPKDAIPVTLSSIPFQGV